MRGLIFALFLVTVISCEKPVVISEQVDHEAPFLMITRVPGSSSDDVKFSRDQVEVGSMFHQRFLSFLAENTDGWASSIAEDYTSDLTLKQEGFTFQVRQDSSAVIQFKDEEGRQQQLSKPLNMDEIRFLFGQ